STSSTCLLNAVFFFPPEIGLITNNIRLRCRISSSEIGHKDKVFICVNYGLPYIVYAGLHFHRQKPPLRRPASRKLASCRYKRSRPLLYTYKITALTDRAE